MNKLLLLILICLSSVMTGIAQDNQPECKLQKNENGDCEKYAIRNVETRFPADSAADDYEVKGFLAKLAFPFNDRYHRVWLKGSEQFPSVVVENSISEDKSITLQAPFYTQITEVPATAKEITVRFVKESGGEADSADKITLYPRPLSEIQRKDEGFGLLFYSCFEPFAVNKETGAAEVLHEKDTLNYLIRQALSVVAKEEEVNYFTDGDTQIRRGKLTEDIKLVVGGGDQMYSDAGYEDTEMQNHPLSAWAHACIDPYPLLDTAAFARHLNNAYLHGGSFRCFNDLFTRHYSVNTWDDHEIRDGWGSHGDEYNDDGTLTKELKPYYMLARQAFVRHQADTGSRQISTADIESNAPLHQSLRVNETDIFVFDLRSNRNSCEKRVISDRQMHDFKKWCNSIADGEDAVMVSSIPFFFLLPSIVKDLNNKVYQGPLRDDITDNWASHANQEQRDTIVNEIIKLRQRGVRPVILSGDVHIGGLITAWYINPNNGKYEKLCYEMISSGLSHESLGEGRSVITGALRKRSRKAEKDGKSFKVNGTVINSTFDFSRGRLNFGLLEYHKDQNPTASLFIIHDDAKSVVKRELELDFDEPLKIYWKRAKRPLWWWLLPWKWGQKKLPEVPYKQVITRKEN